MSAWRNALSDPCLRVHQWCTFPNLLAWTVHRLWIRSPGDPESWNLAEHARGNPSQPLYAFKLDPEELRISIIYKICRETYILQYSGPSMTDSWDSIRYSKIAFGSDCVFVFLSNTPKISLGSKWSNTEIFNCQFCNLVQGSLDFKIIDWNRMSISFFTLCCGCHFFF